MTLILTLINGAEHFLDTDEYESLEEFMEDVQLVNFIQDNRGIWINTSHILTIKEENSWQKR